MFQQNDEETQHGRKYEGLRGLCSVDVLYRTEFDTVRGGGLAAVSFLSI